MNKKSFTAKVSHEKSWKNKMYPHRLRTVNSLLHQGLLETDKYRIWAGSTRSAWGRCRESQRPPEPSLPPWVSLHSHSPAGIPARNAQDGSQHRSQPSHSPSPPRELVASHPRAPAQLRPRGLPGAGSLKNQRNVHQVGLFCKK